MPDIVHPGRLALLTQAAYDPHLTTERRAAHLDIALPAGYDQEAALHVLREALALRDDGHHTQAAELVRDLLDEPPMSGGPA